MAWTGDTFTALLHIAQLHTVYTDISELMAQSSGAPTPSGIWRFAGVEVSSELRLVGSDDVLVGQVPDPNQLLRWGIPKAGGFVSAVGSLL